ncbi:hypothetical protein BDQ94DRAFT_155164 [Aspergillus welwitschiae]|uniref:Uncharacterized protein n=1 Tax=Aspergillus welwitschiae TaxID=1341132 RepID=A0A3F3PJV8_9EURO|nr:hypothetical protein BDQ94DRAFT_155164 [Aspergillus welwitschiae]RDH26656.1 hypothetical protein BDQ94DRAFT_155164 [Aspergillus welwitschiae]
MSFVSFVVASAFWMCATAVLGGRYLLNVFSPPSSPFLPFGFVLTRMQLSSLFCFPLLSKG